MPALPVCSSSIFTDPLQDTITLVGFLIKSALYVSKQNPLIITGHFNASNAARGHHRTTKKGATLLTTMAVMRKTGNWNFCARPPQGRKKECVSGHNWSKDESAPTSAGQCGDSATDLRVHGSNEENWELELLCPSIAKSEKLLLSEQAWK